MQYLTCLYVVLICVDNVIISDYEYYTSHYAIQKMQDKHSIMTRILRFKSNRKYRS